MIQRLLPLLAVVAAAPAIWPLPSETDELQLVQVVIRHGDRAAQDGYATDKSAEVLFRGLGELSDDGIDNAHQQGYDFKKRYVDQYKLIDERYIPSEVRFRASTVPRVLMSAGSFSNALFKRTRGGNVVVPPIYTKDYNDDALLAPDFSCTDGWDDVQTALKLNNTDNVASDSLTAMEQQMWPDSCKDVPSNKVDAIIAELPNKAIKMPIAYDKCAMMPAKQFMYDYIELLGGGGAHYNELRLKRTVGMLTQELLDNMDCKASGASSTECAGKTEKFRVYYSHDVNVLALSHVFQSIDKFKKVTPAFSSALVLELWKSSKTGNHVKIFLKNGQDSEFVYTGLSEEHAKLENVKKFASQFATKEKVACAKPKTA